jgi:hypothetical protein
MSKRPISDISDDDDKSESESDHSVDNTPEHDQFLGIAYDEHAKPFVRRGPNDKWTLFVISQSSMLFLYFFLQYTYYQTPNR